MSAFFSNFTIHDIIGTILGFSLYFLIFLFPGYVTGWFFDIFDFKKRLPVTQVIMAMTISISIVPAILFLIYRYTSSTFAIGSLILVAIIGIYIFITSYKPSSHGNVYKKRSLIFVLLWVSLAILTLVDINIDRRLYFSANSYDFTTRVSVVNAITRTGVPPVNPSYYPGHPVFLNFLYYYWYIPASLVEQMGHGLVSAYHAMIASVSWAGILLFATLSTYLRVRDKQSSQNAWKKSFIAIQLIAVGGLDSLIIIKLLVRSHFHFNPEGFPYQGMIEGWNNVGIMSWMNAMAWAPHHLAAALSCITAMLISTKNMQKKFIQRIPQAVFVGLAFASAFGLSVWVMFVFAIFWVTWGVILFFTEKKYQQVGFMILGGLLGLTFAAPFLLGILQDACGSTSDGGLPVALFIRPFASPSLLRGFPPLVLDILNLLLLPVNYLIELGFFFMIAALWIDEFYKQNRESNPLYNAELILVVVSVIILSFVRSTIIVINDLGIRGWLPVQIILVVWSSDVIFSIIGGRKWLSPLIFKNFNGNKVLGLVLGSMLIIGYLTMSLEFISLRTWSFLVDLKVVGTPNQLTPDAHLGERTYSARLAYDYVRDHIPADEIIQNNPLGMLDRPSGLYGNHQMAISDRTIFGVPIEVYHAIADDIGKIFMDKVDDWAPIDAVCRKYAIDFLVINENDPVWYNMKSFKSYRSPRYANKYYAIYPCGN